MANPNRWLRCVWIAGFVCLPGAGGVRAEPAVIGGDQLEGLSLPTAQALYRVTLHPPLEIGINRYQTWGIFIEDATGKALDQAVVDLRADMPAHGHGLLAQPRIVPGRAPGRYRVEGLRFHMPGYWEIRIQVNQGGKADALLLPVLLE